MSCKTKEDYLELRFRTFLCNVGHIGDYLSDHPEEPIAENAQRWGKELRTMMNEIFNMDIKVSGYKNNGFLEKRLQALDSKDKLDFYEKNDKSQYIDWLQETRAKPRVGFEPEGSKE